MANTLSNFERSPWADAERMRELVANLSCPLCGGTRESSLLVVIDSATAESLVRAQCVRCHLFWSFTLDPAIGPTAPVATRAPAGPITVDEIIDLHGLLDRHRGPLDELLWRRAS